MSRSRISAGTLLAALLLVATLHGAAPVSLTAPPTPPLAPWHTQTFELGGQRLHYAGDAPLPVESGVYWDAPPAAARAIVAIDSAGPYLLVEPGPTDAVRFIVQLDGEPVAARQVALETPDAARRYAAGLHAAQADVLKALAAKGISMRVRRRYDYAYNGLAVTARAGDEEAIARTPGVHAVYPDYEVHALLPESVPLIGAPAVWQLQPAWAIPCCRSTPGL